MSPRRASVVAPSPVPRPSRAGVRGSDATEARLLKLGRQLAVGEVAIRADGDDELVAHVTSTYSIPPGSPVK